MADYDALPVLRLLRAAAKYASDRPGIWLPRNGVYKDYVELFTVVNRGVSENVLFSSLVGLLRQQGFTVQESDARSYCPDKEIYGVDCCHAVHTLRVTR